MENPRHFVGNHNKPHYNLRQNFEFQTVNIRTVRYGTESLTHLANKIWSIIPTEAKNAPTLESFKQQLKLWQTTNCPCGLCKTYVQQVGFTYNHENKLLDKRQNLRESSIS